MKYTTLESLEQEIKEIKNILKEKSKEKDFLLDITKKEMINQGRIDFQKGKSISEKKLRELIE